MAFNTDNENALRQIRDLALRWQECDCMGACPDCINGQIKIQDLAEERIRAIDGPST